MGLKDLFEDVKGIFGDQPVPGPVTALSAKLARFLDIQRPGKGRFGESGGFWALPVASAAFRFEIDSPDRLSAFLAQVGHESAWFKILEENLNYSWEGLRRVFSKYFPTDEIAKQYAHKPEKIANRVYQNRMGNGPEESGDGWKHRGRGPIQITGPDGLKVRGCLGRDSYQEQANLQRRPLLENPDLLLQPGNGMFWAAHWWDRHKLNQWADKGDMEKITRIINGGTNGLEHRLRLYRVCKAEFSK